MASWAPNGGRPATASRDAGLSRLTALTVGLGVTAAVGSGALAMVVASNTGSAPAASTVSPGSGTTAQQPFGDDQALQAPQVTPASPNLAQPPSGLSRGS